MNRQQTQRKVGTAWNTVPAAVRRLAVDESGVVLVVAMWILVLVTVMGVMGTTLSRTELSIAGNSYQQNRAFYAADSGLGRVIATMNDTLFWAEDQTKGATGPVRVFVLAGTTTPDAFATSFGANTGTSYAVTIEKNKPVNGYYLVASTGTVTSSPNTKVTVEAVLRTAPYASWTYATMGCGNYSLKSKGGTEVYGDMFGGSLQLDLGAPAAGGVPAADTFIKGGDVFSRNNVSFNANSAVISVTDPVTGDVLGGNVYAEKNADLSSGALPYAVDGSVVAGGTVSGTGIVKGTVTQGVSPGVADLCLLATLRKTIITQEDIDSYVLHADWKVGARTDFALQNTMVYNNLGVPGLIDWNSKAVDPTKGAVMYVNGGFTIGKTCLPCYYTGVGLVIADSGILINGKFLAKNGMDNPLQDTDKLDRLSLVVRNNNKMDVNDDLDVFGLIQLGSVSLYNNAITGGNANINGGNLNIYGMVFVPGGVFTSNTGGHVKIKFHPIDTTVVRPRYEIGQWRRL
ncbi:MAG: pilus assembly PilX N-terminal domain-containing protein [Nitrospirota bacterium]|nr:pilus assembly PilX N-terminal domain-containing protein [Nitrospirota bacterium]